MAFGQTPTGEFFFFLGILRQKQGAHAQQNVFAGYPYELSGGEYQRVAIARAIMVMPDILICDEATSALDVSVQAQIVNLLLDLREELNMSMIFITHNLPLVSCFGDNLIIMRSGEIVESGNAKEVLNSPKMDYTKNLLSSVLEV